MKELAEIGAASAEDSYRFLEDKFNHNISRRIPLIFYSSPVHFQQTNTIPYILPEGVGGFFEFMKGRVVVPADGSIHNFKRIIRHELVHVFTQSKHFRILKDHKRTSFPELPLWFIEGLAEYWSIGWDSESESVIRDAVLNNYLFPLKDIYQIYGSFLMYKEGQAILKYITEKYGEHKILQLIENSWKSEKFSVVFELTLGINQKQFDDEWTYHLKKDKYPLLRENDSPQMTTTKITKQGINTKAAYYLNDGDPLAVFVSNRMGYANIYTKRLKSLEEKDQATSIIEGERTSEFEAFHILKSKIDVSRNGILTFVSKSGESDVIYTYSLKDKKILTTYRFDQLVSMSSPSWSPDEMKIVFSGINFSGKSDLYIIDVSTGTLNKLTNDFYNDLDPIWTQDGEQIIFSSDRTVFGEGGCHNLFAYHLADGRISFLTFGRYKDYAPAISPDGKQLIFTSDRDGVFNIYMMALENVNGLIANSDTTQDDYPANGNHRLKKITQFTTAAYDAEWTDQNSILFTSFENYSFQINELKNIEIPDDQHPSVTIDSVSEPVTSWKIDKLDGHSKATTVKYKPKFTLDVAQSQIMQDPIFGLSGGAQLALTDMLGNYQYYILVYNNAQTKSDFIKSFNFAVTRADLSKRANKAFGLYHFSGRYFNWYDDYFYERLFGGFFSMSYPISVFQRFEGSLNIRYSDKYWYFSDRSRKALLFSNFLAYVKDNSLWGPTGPLDGERINITLGNTVDVQHSNVNFYTIIADYRKYFRISPRISHAIRLMTRYNQGKEATRFFMGGSWDLRGYPRWQLWGKKIFLVNNELRFPFIDRFIINFPFGGMGISAIRGATFIDLGNAWDDEIDRILGSMGFGFRFRFGGVLVLRFDFGKRFSINDTRHPFDPEQFKLQRGLFKQFFFGWDF